MHRNPRCVGAGGLDSPPALHCPFINLPPETLKGACWGCGGYYTSASQMSDSKSTGGQPQMSDTVKQPDFFRVLPAKGIPSKLSLPFLLHLRASFWRRRVANLREAREAREARIRFT